jgi:hypothetical protein
MDPMFFSERYESHCWCQWFQKYLGFSGKWLSSGLDFPLCDTPWPIWIFVWGCLGIKAHDGGMILGGVGERWMLPGVTIFCLWLSFRTCHLLTECNHIKQKVRMLRKENRQLFAEQKALEECNILRKILCKEDSQKNKNKYSRQSAGRMNEASGVGCPNV